MGYDLDDFEEFAFKGRRVFKMGSGQPIILMHELPGMSPRCLELARFIADNGFEVCVPLLFGQPGVRSSLNMVRVCLSSQFHLFATARHSRITEWLRKLCAHLVTETGCEKIGVIGMCLTGGYVLALMANKHVYAPVMSQPALPLPITPSRRRALGVSDEELKAARDRGIPILALRFEHDRLCPQKGLIAYIWSSSRVRKLSLFRLLQINPMRTQFSRKNCPRISLIRLAERWIWSSHFYKPN
jgi:dienelactone hydrolase